MYLSSKLNHRVNFGPVLISRRIQDLQFVQMLQKQVMLHTVKETLQYLGEMRDNNVLQ